MPTNTYTPIGSVTLATATSEVTFTVPTGYRDLILVVDGQMSSGGVFGRLQFNSDTGNNYANVRMYGTGSSTGSDGAVVSAIDIGEFYTTRGNSIVQIMDYSATDKHKTVISRGNAPGNIILAQAGRWANTNAITSVRFFLTSSTLAVGSTFSLYGIVA